MAYGTGTPVKKNTLLKLHPDLLETLFYKGQPSKRLVVL